MSVILICVLLLSARQLELPAGTLYSSFCETLKLRAVYVPGVSYLLLHALRLAFCYWACRKCREEVELNYGLLVCCGRSTF